MWKRIHRNRREVPHRRRKSKELPRQRKGHGRVVLVTMEPEESTEVIVKPPEQAEKEKGLGIPEPETSEKRESEIPEKPKLPEPEIPEKPFEMEKAKEAPATSEQEVVFRMKAWSNWLHRQDQREEEKRIKNQSAAAGAETAASVGSGHRPAASSSKRTILTAVVDRIKGRPGAKGVSPESVEATHQSSSEGADCEVATGRTRSPSLPGYRKGRVHGAEQAPSLDRAKGTSAAESVWNRV